MATPLPTAKLPDLPDERFPAAGPSPPPSGGGSEPASGTSSPRPAAEVPKTYASSFTAWWSQGNKHEELVMAEERLLRRLPSFIPLASTPDPLPTASNPDPLISRVMDFPLPAPRSSSPAGSTTSSLNGAASGASSRLPFFGRSKVSPPRYLHGLAFWTPKTKSKSKEINVLLHGYGAALGFFFNNLETFGSASAESGRRAFALDWLGMGLSARPSPKEFDLPPAPKPRSSPPLTAEESAAIAEERVRTRVLHAEDFFVQALEDWRKSVGAEKMCLVGHSLGGYLSAAYTLRYPERVSKLILLSPAGIPANPYAESDKAAAAPIPPKTSRLNFQPKQQEEPTGEETAELADAAQKELGQTRTEVKAGEEPIKPVVRPSSRIRSVIGWAWEQGYSPFGVLRALGPLAPKTVGMYSSRRFEGLSETDVRDMHALIYGISMARGSGEFCIHHLLAPGAFARWPMQERLGDLKQPIAFLYGASDWMDVKGGFAVKEILKKRNNPNCEVITVPNAGHHLYLDNADFTNKELRRLLRDLPASA